MSITNIIIGSLSLWIVLSGVILWLLTRGKRSNAYHLRMQLQSRQALAKLQVRAKQRPGAVISYLRKINPHAFEEIILDAAQEAGHRVKRNDAYTGDGGIDGEIEVDGVWHLVQAKRYSKAINPAHVGEFSQICAIRRQPGLFIHTGRTGDKSRSHSKTNVKFISGQSLVDFIAGRSLNSSQPIHEAA